MALSGAEAKAEKLNLQKKKLDEVMKKTQDIIDQMLPKQISAVSFLLKPIFVIGFYNVYINYCVQELKDNLLLWVTFLRYF